MTTAKVLLIIFQAMSDSQAAVAAHNIWGDKSVIAFSPRGWTDVQWSKDVGFASPGCKENFTVVGHGYNTWEAAFAAAPAGNGITGPVKGIHTLKADSPGITTPAPLSSEPVPGVVTGIQFIVDGQPLGAKLVTNGVLPWHVQIDWDTTKVADGIHSVCAQLTRADGSSVLTRGAAIMVKQ